ncbi:hypothetical protein AAE478_005706 [Parahypoxylon ruwenzoriense]
MASSEEDLRGVMQSTLAEFLETYPLASISNTLLAPEISLMEEARVKVLESVIDPATRQASACTEHWTKLMGHKPTPLEISWFVNFTNGGKDISRVVEVIDTSIASKIIGIAAEQSGKTVEAATGA